MVLRNFYQIAYMDVRTGSATLAEISTSTLAAPARPGLAAGGAKRRKSEIERRAQRRAHRGCDAFDLRGKSDADRSGHDTTLPLREEIVILDNCVSRMRHTAGPGPL
jgi:hypothetical protein